MYIYIAEDLLDNCDAKYLAFLGKIFNSSDFHELDPEKQEVEISLHLDTLSSNDFYTSIVEIRYFLCIHKYITLISVIFLFVALFLLCPVV